MAKGPIATIKRAIHREKELFQIQIAMQGRKIANGLARSSPMSENHDIQEPGYNEKTWVCPIVAASNSVVSFFI